MSAWPEVPSIPPSLRHQSSRPSTDPPVEDPQFQVRTPVRTIAELVVSDDVRSRLDTAMALLDHHALLYGEWGLSSLDPHRTGTAINLYGAPGTGKSLAAEAIAHRQGLGLLEIDYAELESKYVGQTSKNIVKCFASAREQKAALVFNEADSILGSRLSMVTQSADHSVNMSRAVMLSQLDRFDGLVVFTTNFPRNYDSAFVRRILTHVRFDLPDVDTRRRLWHALIPDCLPHAEPFPLDLLAERSDGLAGGDLVNVIIAAAGKAVRRPPESRFVENADLLAEIEVIRRAKCEVGKSSDGLRLVSSDEVASLPSHPINVT